MSTYTLTSISKSQNEKTPFSYTLTFGDFREALEAFYDLVARESKTACMLSSHKADVTLACGSIIIKSVKIKGSK